MTLDKIFKNNVTSDLRYCSLIIRQAILEDGDALRELDETRETWLMLDKDELAQLLGRINYLRTKIATNDLERQTDKRELQRLRETLSMNIELIFTKAADDDIEDRYEDTNIDELIEAENLPEPA